MTTREEQEGVRVDCESYVAIDSQRVERLLRTIDEIERERDEDRATVHVAMANAYAAIVSAERAEADAAVMRRVLIEAREFLRVWDAEAPPAPIRHSIDAALTTTAGAALLEERDALRAKVEAVSLILESERTWIWSCPCEGYVARLIAALTPRAIANRSVGSRRYCGTRSRNVKSSHFPRIRARVTISGRRAVVERTKQLTRSTSLRRSSWMRRKSPKGAARAAVRSDLVARILDDRPLCEACLAIVSVDSAHECGGFAVDVHEPLTRGRGGDHLDEMNTVTVCRRAHDWIHDHPREAKTLDLLRSSPAAVRTELTDRHHELRCWIADHGERGVSVTAITLRWGRVHKELGELISRGLLEAAGRAALRSAGVGARGRFDDRGSGEA